MKALIMLLAVLTFTGNIRSLAAEAKTANPNLVANPGFEQKGQWWSNWSWCDLDARMKEVTTQAVEGKRCLEVECKRFVSGAVLWKSAPIKIVKGKTYKLSFYYRGNKVSMLKGGLRMINTPWSYYISQEVTPLAQWQKAEIIGIAPRDDDAAAVYFLFRDSGTVWIDDVVFEEVVLEKVAAEKRGNMVANSSFELDNVDNWMVERTKFINPAWEIEKNDAFHGKRSLKIKGGGRKVVSMTFYYNLKGRCDHIFSAYLKSDRTAKVKMCLKAKNGSSVFEKEFTVGKEWKRYSVSGNSRISVNNCYYLSFEIQNGNLWIDAVYFTEGDKLCPYAPQNVTEAVAKVHGTPSKFFVEGKTVNAVIEAVNYDWLNNKTTPVACTWGLYDWYGKREQGGKINASPSAATSKISITPKKRGMYRLVVKPENGLETEDVFAVVPTPKFVRNSPFGGHFSFDEMDFDIVKKIGMVQERTHWPPIYTQWRIVERQKGRWNWSALDNAVALAKENNIGIYASIAGTPAWAYPKNRKVGPAWNTYKVVYPTDISLWENYVREIVKRYPYITAWEIFNEPHVDIFFNGTDEELIKLFIAAAKVIKEVNPHAKVSGFGDGPHATVNSHLALLKKHNALQYLDAVTMHLYLYGDTDKAIDVMLNYVNRTRKFLDSNGCSRIEIWDTEEGYGNNSSFRKKYYNLGHEKNASGNVKFIIKNNAVKLSFGIKRLFLYLINNVSQLEHLSGHGLVDFDYAPTPILAAYAVSTSFLADAKPEGAVNTAENMRAHCFERNGDKKKIIIAWTLKGEKPLVLKKLPAGTEVYDEMGNKVKKNISVEEMPRYFVIPPAELKAFIKLLK